MSRAPIYNPLAEFCHDTFQISHTCGGDRVQFTHVPSGRFSELAPGDSLAERNRVLVALVDQLRAAGIAPQPPPVGRKRIGKPRHGSPEETV